MQAIDIYQGSNGDQTKEYYRRLSEVGPEGLLAVNLFRAHKCSSRAKVYRGGVPGKGSYRSMAYERKQWSMRNLCEILMRHAEALGIPWGWKRDPETPVYEWVLYVDLPEGQVSFHTDVRGQGPDYTGEWDGELARRTHPDQGGTAEAFQRVQKAYDEAMGQ